MPNSPQLISVNCNHCGAPLEIPPGARFVTCAHCGSQLEVHRSGSAFYTEVLGEIADRTARIERDVQQIKRQNEIEALDREWEARRQSLLVRGNNGSVGQPSKTAGVIGGVIVLAFGIFWTGTAISIGAPGFFPLFGVLFIGVGIFASVSQFNKAGQFEEAEAEYRRRRTELLQKSNDLLPR